MKRGFKSFLILTLVVSGLSCFAQDISLNNLYGTWYCYKATMGSKDMTETYKDHYITFNSDSTYKEEMRYYFNTTAGTFNLNRQTKILSFKNLVSTTKYPNAKVKMKDLVMDISKRDEKIRKLNNENLVLMHLKGGELQDDTKLFYRRNK